MTINNPMTEGKNIPVAGLLFRPHKIPRHANWMAVNLLTTFRPNMLKGESSGSMETSETAPLTL